MIQFRLSLAPIVITRTFQDEKAYHTTSTQPNMLIV